MNPQELLKQLDNLKNWITVQAFNVEGFVQNVMKDFDKLLAPAVLSEAKAILTQRLQEALAFEPAESEVAAAEPAKKPNLPQAVREPAMTRAEFGRHLLLTSTKLEKLFSVTPDITIKRLAEMVNSTSYIVRNLFRTLNLRDAKCETYDDLTTDELKAIVAHFSEHVYGSSEETTKFIDAIVAGNPKLTRGGDKTNIYCIGRALGSYKVLIAEARLEAQKACASS